MTPTTFTIDCDTCPGRGRMCGDCFVPVLGRVWLQDPPVRRTEAPDPTRPDVTLGSEAEPARGAPLDSDELAAVSAFVRAGLVDPDEAAAARAQLTARSAAG
ncbi:hypothetical protein [Ornithinimicrobium pratense]|uniref:Uncharacterized protein n=1 Tax=Ornithinimicrobium pratense TaxID=2593973 RepID=A0A5J6V5F2_9MICO|nr:hypothetical protein [Ornithinimicrobium pratense]QFG68243.1 hypothetical protein FY030_05505 [Ornithinimicrobium pratense]